MWVSLGKPTQWVRLPRWQRASELVAGFDSRAAFLGSGCDVGPQVRKQELSHSLKRE